MHKYHHYFFIGRELRFSRFLSNKYNDLLIADTLRLVSLSMISIFLPLYLLKLSYSVRAIALMELALFVLSIFLHYFVLKNIGRWGVKKVLISSYFLNIVFYAVLYYAKNLMDDFSPFVFLFLLVIFNSLPIIFYWTAHHIYFLKATKARHQGEKLGLLKAVPVVAGVFSPLIGSVVIDNFGFKGAFVVSAFLLILATKALFLSKDISVKIKLKKKKILDFKNFKKNWIFFIQGVGYVSTGFIWPIMLFLLSIKIISIGFLYLFSDLAYAFVVYFGGKNIDKKGNIKFGKLGVVGHGFSLILRALTSTILFLSTFQTMGGIFGGLMHVAFDTGFYKKSHHNIGSAIMNRELYMYLGRIFTILIFLFLYMFFSVKNAFVFTLIISGLIIFSSIIFIRRDNFIIN